MPIPIYHATAIEQAGLLGGSTKPSIMTVQDKSSGLLIGNYVVKVFKRRNIQQYQPTNKEVYCHLLASEFDLETPKGALVHVGEGLIEQLKAHADYASFKEELKEGHYFGTEYLPNTKPFIEGISEKLLPSSDLENIFAFDVLIRNMDRNIKKPNLIILNKNTPILIDHDIALDIQKTFSDYNKLGLWNVFKGKKRHILQKYLQQTNAQNLWAFDEFLEYLRNLNINNLYKVKEILESNGQSVIDFDPIIGYLNEVKQDPASFRELLLSLIK